MHRKYAALISTVAVVSVALLASAGAVAAKPPGPGHYTLIDAGTLGGPQAFLNAPGFILTENGALLGTADTATPMPITRTSTRSSSATRTPVQPTPSPSRTA